MGATGQTISDECRDHQAKQRTRLAQRSKVYQCLEMQEDVKAALSAGSVTPTQRAALIAAWDKLEDRIRILQGKPLPGALTHEKVSRGKRGRGSLAESMLASLASDAGHDQVEQQPAPTPTPDQTEPTEQPT